MESAQTIVTIEDEMRQSYMDYAMSVIVGRALPDVRDGLKPVQRRVLVAMFDEGHVPGKKHSKCAGVVGEVLKRLHPHGDQPVYDALVRLAQPWNMRYPLIDGQGNFGSVDGDPPAAYRYTECRMTKLSERMLADIGKDTVDFIPNFDDSSTEPVVLPAIVPNLLINGSQGIAVGMASRIPPHNLREIIAAVTALIRTPGIGHDELLALVPGPDFPTGGIIQGRAGIKQSFLTGRGNIQIRGKVDIERIKTGTREADAIVVTEIPYQVNKTTLIERIAELITSKDIDGIAKFRDESDRSGMRIVMELKKEATAEVVLNQLYKSSPLQISFGVINLAIVEGQPVTCSTPDLMRRFIDHRRDVVTRRTQFELRQAQDRMHILEGFRIALINIDEIIQLIKAADSPRDARDALMTRFSLSETQSQAILDLRLQKLTGLERLAIEQEHGELAEEIKRLIAILADTNLVDDIIVEELKEIADEFGDERRTQIIEEEGEDFVLEDFIEDKEMAVTISHGGYAKRTPLSEYRAQKRGGKGVSGASTKDDDYIEHLFVASAKSYILFMTSRGWLYWVKVFEIPETGRVSRGRSLVNLLNLKSSEDKITAIIPIQEFKENSYLVMATRKGVIKKSPLSDFLRAKKHGMVACSLDDGDQMVGVTVTSGTNDIVLATQTGMAIRFDETDVRPMGRAARGVRAISLEGDDIVVGMTSVQHGQEEVSDNEDVASDVEQTEQEGELTLLTVCERGYGKRTKVSGYRVQGRGGKGLIDIKTDERNGMVVSAFAISNDASVMLITSAGKIIRFQAKDIPLRGRNTMGVKLVDLEDGERVLASSPFVESDGQDDSSGE
jgi:DNA gyrase subunit A